MNRHEKIAWYNLTVIGASILLFTALFFTIKNSHTLEDSFRISSSAFGLLGLLGLGQTLFRKEGAGRRIPFFDPELDERDREIYRRAGMHAFAVVWILYVLAVMGIWLYFRVVQGVDGPVILSVNVDLLPWLIWPVFMAMMLVFSVSTLLQQRKGPAAAEDIGLPFVPGRRGLILSLWFFPVLFLVGFLVARTGAWLFAFQFVTLAIGAFAMTVREIRRKAMGPEENASFRCFMIVGRASNILFTILFAALMLTYAVRVVTLESFHGIYVAYLFVLIFIALIFQRTVLTDLKHYLRERGHEKA